MSRTLILTATITPPPGVPSLVRTDPAVRLRDYLRAFEFYLRVPGRDLPMLVFAENSGSDLAPFRDLAARVGGDKRVVVTGHQGLDHPVAYGRGYGEMKLMDRIVRDCPEVASLPGDCVIWKGTGRYMMSNLVPLMDSMPAGAELYCDLRNRPFRWLEMRFFACTLDGYRRLLMGRYAELREDIPYEPDRPGWNIPEVNLRRAIDPHLGEPGIVPRFRVEPYVAGVRGWDNRSYVEGVNLLKYHLRAAARRVLPGLWI